MLFACCVALFSESVERFTVALKLLPGLSLSWSKLRYIYLRCMVGFPLSTRCLVASWSYWVSDIVVLGLGVLITSGFCGIAVSLSRKPCGLAVSLALLW